MYTGHSDLESPRVRNARGMNGVSRGEGEEGLPWGTKKTARGSAEQAEGGGQGG